MKFGSYIMLAVFASSVLVAIAVTLLLLHIDPAAAVETRTDTTVDPGVVQWALMAGAIAVGLSSLAAGYAVAVVGSAAVGALAEKPELMGRVVILVGLAEGIAIYGLVVAILILNRAG